MHYNEQYEGERFSLVFFKHSSYDFASDDDKVKLKELAFRPDVNNVEKATPVLKETDSFVKVGKSLDRSWSEDNSCCPDISQGRTASIGKVTLWAKSVSTAQIRRLPTTRLLEE